MQPSRRALFGGISTLFAGAAGAALPAAASASRPLSAVDRQVLDLWDRRAELRASADHISDRLEEVEAQLPAWGRGGPCRAPRHLITDLVAELRGALGKGKSEASVLGEYAHAFAEFAERSLQREAEEERLGLDVLKSGCHDAWEATNAVEFELEKYVDRSILGLAACLMIAIKDDDPENIGGLHYAALGAIRPELVGLIAEDADRMLASATTDEEEA